MDIPDVKYKDKINPIVKLDPHESNNRLFDIDGGNKIVIADFLRTYFLDGKICPPNGQYRLTVLIESEVIGKSTIDIYINIESDIEEDLRFEFRNVQG